MKEEKYYMMRNDSKVFQSFGEIYFSTIYKDVIKAWHLHKEAAKLRLCKWRGKISSMMTGLKVIVGDIGNFSHSRKLFLVTIPPNIWSGFKGLAKEGLDYCELFSYHTTKKRWSD